jgi:hypothetical protein
MGDDYSELISLVMQFVASFCWAIGAAMAGPSTHADKLQLAAAVAWCLANTASAWGMATQPKERNSEREEEERAREYGERCL